ncbi:conserved Plasmodium protein, unknown function [Plasmodium malariae]|uniref:Uncharacterized protein n=1 Tax=Plasmodium malariae TaxID=5858 RepID=A0A1C3KY47_PLAMA|nr:conserved Plasmodium protein, unknown function [Plasmodium malariae]
MDTFAILPKRFEKGLVCLADTLLKILVFNLYYSFDKIKEYKVVRGYGKRGTEILNLKNLEKSKKNIEKCIGLCLTVLKSIEGDNNFFMQYILENYCSIHLYNSVDKMKKKNKIKFDDTFLISQLYNYSSPCSREKILRNMDEEVNENREAEINILIGNEQVNSYMNKIPIMDSFIDKHKIYSKNDLIDELNNFLDSFYLNKVPIKEDNEKFIISQKRNLIDDDCVTKNLFSEYFNNCRKNNKLNILIKELNLDSLKNFHNILLKNINFIRAFNSQNNDKENIDNLELSTFFDF